MILRVIVFVRNSSLHSALELPVPTFQRLELTLTLREAPTVVFDNGVVAIVKRAHNVDHRKTFRSGNYQFWTCISSTVGEVVVPFRGPFRSVSAMIETEFQMREP